MIYDEFSRLNTSGDFRKFVSETISEETDKNENIIKIQNYNHTLLEQSLGLYGQMQEA